jgi:hypothetical protein
MKYFNFSFLFFLILISCNKDNQFHPDYKITEGYYMGTFTYQNKKYFSEIVFDKNKYEEFPSGGFIYQKAETCLSIGRDTIIDDILSFKLDSIKYNFPGWECNPNMFLPGEYKINLLNEEDSLVFSRGLKANLIVYNLKRLKL